MSDFNCERCFFWRPYQNKKAGDCWAEPIPVPGKKNTDYCRHQRPRIKKGPGITPGPELDSEALNLPGTP